MSVTAPAADASVGDQFTATVSAATLAIAGSIASVSVTVDGRTTPLVYDAVTQRWSATIGMSASTTGTKTVAVLAVDLGVPEAERLGLRVVERFG